MNTEIKNAIQAADSEAQYDESAKRLLAQKYVLAHILVRTVEEFQGMEIEKVVSLIEGDPYISKVPVASGLTNNDRNMEGKRFVGLNTEAGEKMKDWFVLTLFLCANEKRVGTDDYQCGSTKR